MIYQMVDYADAVQFNEDAARLHKLAEFEAGPLGYPCYFKVELVIPLKDDRFRVVWSRPTPMKRH